MNFKNKQLRKVTRVEVIDKNGRSYVNWDNCNEVTASFQDDGKTMKIFINKDKTKEKEPKPPLFDNPSKSPNLRWIS